MKYPKELAESIANEFESRILKWDGVEQDYMLGGLSPMRLRWDMLHALPEKFDRFIHPAYDLGLHDDHIDTALRYAARMVGFEWAATK